MKNNIKMIFLIINFFQSNLIYCSDFESSKSKNISKKEEVFHLEQQARQLRFLKTSCSVLITYSLFRLFFPIKITGGRLPPIFPPHKCVSTIYSNSILRKKRRHLLFKEGNKFKYFCFLFLSLKARMYCTTEEKEIEHHIKKKK